MLLVHSQSTCDVCLETYNLLPPPDGKTPWAIPCGHTFCQDCLQKTTPSNCPLCRRGYNPDRIKRLHVDRPTESTENETARDVTKWLEQIALASAGQSNNDDWMDVARDAQIWLEGRSPDTYCQYPALQAAISTLERFKDLQSKRREEKQKSRDLQAKLERRYAEHVEYKRLAKVIEENMSKQLSLCQAQLAYWNDNFPNESEQLRARIIRETGAPPELTKTPTPPEAYVNSIYTTSSSDEYQSTTGHNTNPLPRPPQPTTYPGEESTREELIDQWTSSAYTLTDIPHIGQPQPRPSGGAAFMPGARNLQGVHPSRPPRLEVDEFDYRPDSPTPRPRSRSRGRHAENGERRRHRHEGETEHEREERKRKHREKARARRLERDTDEAVQGPMPTSGNALGIRAFSSSMADFRAAETGVSGLGSSSTGVNMIAGPSQAGPSRTVPSTFNTESYDNSLGLLDAPTPRRAHSPLPFSASDTAAAPTTRSYPSRPPTQHPPISAPQHIRSPHDSIDSWGTVSSQGVGSIIPHLVNFPPYPRGINNGNGDGDGTRTTYGRAMSMTSVLTLAPGPSTLATSGTDISRPQVSHYFTMPVTTDAVSQRPMTPHEHRATTAASRRVSLSRSLSQPHTPRPAGSQASVSTTTSSIAAPYSDMGHGLPWMEVGGASQARPAGWPYAPVPQVYAVAAPQVSMQSLQSLMGADASA